MILGRTNTQFESPWYRPVVGPNHRELAEALATDGPSTIIDVSTQPALWGGMLRSYRGGYLVRSARDLERATGAKHAAELLDAHLIEMLSSLGRESLDFYCLRVRSPLSEEVVGGIFQALESARADGMVRFFGLAPEDESEARVLWQAHDAFEVVLLTDGSALSELASERRVGIVWETEGEPTINGIWMHTVDSPDQVRAKAKR